MVSFSRSTEKLAAAGRPIGPDTRLETPLEGASACEVILLATPWAAALDVARKIAPVTHGKVVWNATNPLKVDVRRLELGTTTFEGEEVVAALPEAHMVKTAPPMAELLAQDGPYLIDGRAPGVFVCGDDADARAQVRALVGEIGADGVDGGPLASARYTEPLGMLLVQLACGRAARCCSLAAISRCTPLAKPRRFRSAKARSALSRSSWPTNSRRGAFASDR